MQLRAPTVGRIASCQGAKRHVIVRTASPSAPATASKSTSPFLKSVKFLNPIWANVENEKQFAAVLTGMLAKVPGSEKMLPLWLDFYQNYKAAVMGSDQEGANEYLATKIQATIADVVTMQYVKPFTFGSHHERITGPDYDYFEFGQSYVGSLTDFKNSCLGHAERWDKVAELLKQNHNVVLLANHQTEADPGVFAHMLMSRHPQLATDVIYVAGDRVVTDALSKPFSMGRNLFCVHSKKHLDDVPELKASKMETNRKTLVAMQRALNKGGALIWIAPSGGRDRPKPDGSYTPDPYDPAAVELMRNLVQRAKQPGHLYPMAMFSWPVMPPPKTVDKAIGERRLIGYTGVGISLCEELDIAATHKSAGAGDEDKEAQQKALAKAAEEAVIAEYLRLEAAIRDPSKRGPGTAYSQPWLSK